MNDALMVGTSVAGGGSLTAFLVKFLFNGVTTRLDKIEESLEAMSKVNSDRHEGAIREGAKLESKVDAAHRRLDELNDRLNRIESQSKRKR